MNIEYDIPIDMADGVQLRADIYRPEGSGTCPVLLAMGPYGKGLSFSEGYPAAWQWLITAFPEVLTASTGQYMCWEYPDPERWVPAGYACVRVDSRGAGRSPGYLDVFSATEARDLFDCIEWAGTREWSNGKVGLLGISYYAMNQWQVAALRPPHLAAMCVWEGAADLYRDAQYHGGIPCDFQVDPSDRSWYMQRVVSRQHGQGERGPRSAVTGDLVSGPETFSDAVLAANRVDFAATVRAHPWIDEYHRDRTPDLTAIQAPLLSAGNWGGLGLHLRGNMEGYLEAGSSEKWLEVHGHTHFAPFYKDEGVLLQQQFFGHFLKGEANGWEHRPPIELCVRYPGEKFIRRAESEWPLARTRWSTLYLDPAGLGLSRDPSSGSVIEYSTQGDGVTFLSDPVREETEITGPVAAKLYVSSHTTDADIFLALRAFDESGNEITFIGANDPKSPVTLGWLRASHRKLDLQRSKQGRPFHSHDRVEPLTPGESVEMEVELWPTSIVLLPGYRIGLNVRGCDYRNEPHKAPHGTVTMSGVGPMSHTVDRPADIFDTVNVLHFEEGRSPYVVLPLISGEL